MFGWAIVVVCLIAEILLLSILLLPMPLFLSNNVVSILNKLQKALWLLLLVLSALLASSWFDMTKAEVSLDSDTGVNNVGKDILLHNKKWRAERNFYLVAYTWTLLAILLRCHSIMSKSIKLESDLKELYDMHVKTTENNPTSPKENKKTK